MKSVVITGERVMAKKDGNWGNLFCVLYQEEYQASYRKLELNTYSEGCPKGGRENGHSIWMDPSVADQSTEQEMHMWNSARTIKA